MENVGESSKQKKPRLNWKKESVVKKFLEACIHEVAVNGRDGSSLKMLSWKNIGEILKKEHNFIGPASNLPNDCEDSANVVSLEDDDIQHVQAIPSSTQEPLNLTQECSGPQTKKRKLKQASTSNKSAVEEEFSKVVQLMMEKHRGDDIDACMEKLENVGWGTHNPLYDAAVMLFSESADHRKVWMRLKPESLENWVRNAGRKYGILD
ncbi:hypothetical protein Tco_0767562 [Tanacetum coccineum]